MCEIDIISMHKNIVYFTESKFRTSDKWGVGSSYVTTKKLKQMDFAAQLWMHENNWYGDAQMLVASVDKNMHVDIYEVN